MSKSPEELEAEIMKQIKVVGDFCNDKDGNTIWTMTIKQHLWKLGESEGFITCGHGCDHSEWLFDLCWYQDPDDHFRRLIITVECEWKNQRETWEQYYYSVRFDFDKLLIARADHRIMIFEQENRDSFLQTVRKLISRVDGFDHSQSSDRYLFAGWLQRERKFDFERYVID